MNSYFLRFSKKQVAAAIFVALLGCFFYLLYLPVDHFDQGQSICLSVLLTETECYACGMTRAIHHLIHADFNAAWHFNKLSFIVLPLAIYMTCKSLYKMYKEEELEVQQD